MSAQKTRWKLLVVVLCVILVGGVFANFFLDSDGDGIPNLQEAIKGTDMFNPDTDGDKLLDGHNVILPADSELAKKFVKEGFFWEPVVDKPFYLKLLGELDFGADPLKPNPNINYALSNKIPVESTKHLVVLDEDGKMDADEKILLSYLNDQLKFDPINIPAQTKFINKVIDKILADKKVSHDEAKALAYLSKYPISIQENLINYGLDDVTINLLLLVSSSQDQNFALYTFRNKLCIQDHKLTDLEKKFLQEPEKYKEELFKTYITEIDKIHPELFREIEKLYTVQLYLKQINIKDVEAAEDILDLVKNSDTKGFFDQMFNIGIKDKRKYCSPLEALVWILYDKEPDAITKYLRDSITLTGHAWRDSSTSNYYSSERWQNFDEVVDRLNSPELAALYINANIRYIADVGDHWQSALETFNTKGGDCEDYAALATYCLAKNGYEAYGLSIKTQTTGHMTCVYRYPGNPLIYCLNNPGIVLGPFDTYDKVATKFGGSVRGLYKINIYDGRFYVIY